MSAAWIPPWIQSHIDRKNIDENVDCQKILLQHSIPSHPGPSKREEERSVVFGMDGSKPLDCYEY